MTILVVHSILAIIGPSRDRATAANYWAAPIVKGPIITGDTVRCPKNYKILLNEAGHLGLRRPAAALATNVRLQLTQINSKSPVGVFDSFGNPFRNRKDFKLLF